MEEPCTVKCNILACIPKAASPVSFQLSPPQSPVKATGRKGFNSPFISLVPKEARRKPKNGSFEEPTSPKVSCMGQVKNKKKKNKRKQSMSKGKGNPVVPQVQEIAPVLSPEELKKKPFKGKKQGDNITVIDDNKPGAGKEVPSLGQVQRYTSSRGGVLENFDWRTCEGEEDNKEKEKEKTIIPCSASAVAGEPRKEALLWKRRNKDHPPLPLQV